MSHRVDTEVTFSLYFDDEPERLVLREFFDRVASTVQQHASDAGLSYSHVKLHARVGYEFLAFYDEDPNEVPEL